ncbi:hypothetical protein [Paenibacillus periandrae]|uniref:hypothetical protein n=1 Tax=Paenibacillus periandrae TaxID=1761741 RepID=UPI001F0897B9|nr:hypothetical protein [Paenibacillus periandrae]
MKVGIISYFVTESWLSMENSSVNSSVGLNNRHQALRNTLNKIAQNYGSHIESANRNEQTAQKTTPSYLSARTKKKEAAKSTGVIVGAQTSKKSMSVIMHKARVNKDLAKQLCMLNAKRGGKFGFKGFLFEHLHAANETANGIITMVINDNGVADFVIKRNGRKFFAQAKVGQANKNINFAKYKGQTLIVDKGNTVLVEKARKAGMKVVESDISNKQVTQLGKTMQLEQKITGNKNAVVTSKTYTTTNNLSNAHLAGVQAAKSGAQFGAGVSIGSNLVDVITGEKDLKEAAKDVVVDTAISAGTAYVAGAAVAAVAQTTAGAAVASAAGVAGAAVAGTTVGGAAIAAGAAVTGAVTGAAAAATASTVAAASAVTSAVASTAVGGAIATAGTAIAGTAVGGAVVAAGAVVGAAAVAAAPIVLPAIAIGAALKVGIKLFSRRRW